VGVGFVRVLMEWFDMARMTSEKFHVSLVVCKPPFHKKTILGPCRVGSHFGSGLDHILTMTRKVRCGRHVGPSFFLSFFLSFCDSGQIETSSHFQVFTFVSLSLFPT